MTEYLTISRHYLRRRARAQAERLMDDAARVMPDVGYRVLRLERGPYRWRVVSYVKEQKDPPKRA